MFVVPSSDKKKLKLLNFEKKIKIIRNMDTSSETYIQESGGVLSPPPRISKIYGFRP